MLRIEQLKLNLNEPTSKIPEKIAKQLGISPPEKWKIIRESIDARDKSHLHFIYTVDFEATNEKVVLKKALRRKNIKIRAVDIKPYELPYSCYKENANNVSENDRPVIVGFGPCGMFAALILAQAGMRPVVFERGRRIEERIADVERFWNTGILDPESNVQFGEGGAGTFSDGKLTTGIKDSRIAKVNSEFIKAGADESIAYVNMPHIGTDVLRKVVINIRKKIIALGGEVRFESKLTGLNIEKDRICSIVINDSEVVKCKNLILSPGNSARDTVKMLYESGVKLEAKSFSVGARIEHPQIFIDESQYGEHRNDSEGRLGAAAYKLSHHCADGRGVYTFCMCPGGQVIAAASESEGLVTNGMSYQARNGQNANSALLVSITPEDYMPEGSDNLLAGFEFQRKLEKKAYDLGGGKYIAPVQCVGNFLKRKSADWEAEYAVEPSYKPGVKWADISECLPDFAVSAMREALPELGKKLKGFDMDEAVFTAVETRSSSPVRILRDRESLQSVSVKGFYPGGEGAGYAGGIMSAAVDGIRIAETVIRDINFVGIKR